MKDFLLIEIKLKFWSKRNVFIALMIQFIIMSNKEASINLMHYS